MLFSYASFANDKDNGGDICEQRILSIRSDLQLWIHKNEYKQMRFNGEIKELKYKTAMFEAMNNSVISCTTKSVSIGQSEKTCINTFDEKLKKPIIKCNFTRFQKTNESKQYRLIHHEFAGVAGLEVNNSKEESNYYFSEQIIGFLKDTTIKKLVVNSYNYPKSNYLEVRAEFKRRYECGTDEDAPDIYYCKSGLRINNPNDESGAQIDLHILDKKKSFNDVEEMAFGDTKHISKHKSCSKDRNICIGYYTLENDQICELYYYITGESAFSCLNADNSLSYVKNIKYFLPQKVKEPGDNLGKYIKNYTPIEPTVFDMIVSLYAPISKDFGEDEFPESLKTVKLKKEVTELFRTLGTKVIQFAEITSSTYIGRRVELQYRETGRFSIDLEKFSFGDQGYSSLYIIENKSGDSVCWSNSQDEDDDMNICFNADGSIHYTFLYFG